MRLARAVAPIFSDGILAEHLALRGGTVLHKGHLAPAARYSEDLDLVLIKSTDRNALDARLRAVLAPVLGGPSDSVSADAWLAVRNVWKPSKILRTLYEYVPLGLRYLMTVKVEVNLNERRSLFPFVDVQIALLDDDGELQSCAARSYDINEMLGTKLRAQVRAQQQSRSDQISHLRGGRARLAGTRPLLRGRRIPGNVKNSIESLPVTTTESINVNTGDRDTLGPQTSRLLPVPARAARKYDPTAGAEDTMPRQVQFRRRVP